MDKKALKTSLISGAFGVAAWYTYQNYSIEEHKESLIYKSLPKNFDNFKIAHIADLHNYVFGKNNCRVLNMVAKNTPNIITLGGDILNKTFDKTTEHFINNIVKLAPTYFVTGNHEFGATNWPEMEHYLKECGVHVLRNENEKIKIDDEFIYIVGIDDPNFHYNKCKYTISAEKILGDIPLHEYIPKDGFTVMISHRPELFEAYVEQDVNLALCGHTHGGQIRLPGGKAFAAPHQGLFPKYNAGVFENNENKMIVSRGLGNSLVHIRINDRPEIVFVTLKKGE